MIVFVIFIEIAAQSFLDHNLNEEQNDGMEHTSILVVERERTRNESEKTCENSLIWHRFELNIYNIAIQCVRLGGSGFTWQSITK